MGKVFRTKPSIWCHVCGWVRFSCSDLVNVVDYRTRKDFLGTKCSHMRRLVPANKDKFSKLHSKYTNCDNPAAFGSRQSLKTVSRCSYSDVDKYLASSETYTKFKQTIRRFIRLKVQSFRLIEIWSVGLADMQKLSRANDGVRYRFVAVDTLSRFLWVYPIKGKSAKSCADALNSIITCCQAGRQQLQPKFFLGMEKLPANPEKIWVDKGRDFAGEFVDYCRERSITIYSTCSETKSVFAERNIGWLKALIFKYLHENNTDIYLDQLPNFVSIINGRINHVTHIAPKNVDLKDVPFLISLQATNKVQEPKFKIGQNVRIRRKINTFHRGYRIQFTEEVFIAAIQTLNPPTYSISDCNKQVIQGKFFAPELVHFQHINNNGESPQH